MTFKGSHAISLFGYLFAERKQCKVHLCPLKCPEYKVRNIKNDQQNSARMQADISVEGIEIPFGTMQYIELGVKLESENVSHTEPDPITELNVNTDNYIVFGDGTINNMILNGRYRPYIIIRSNLVMKNTIKGIDETVPSTTRSCIGKV